MKNEEQWTEDALIASVFSESPAGRSVQAGWSGLSGTPGDPGEGYCTSVKLGGHQEGHTEPSDSVGEQTPVQVNPCFRDE